MGGVIEQVQEHWGRSRHGGRALKRRVLGTIDSLLRLHYFVFDGERNYEIDFLQVLAVQLLDFSGFVCCLYWFLRRIYVSVSFGSWKVLEAKRVVICIGLWGLEDLCLDGCSVFGECFSEVLLRCERLPFASQLVWLELVWHGHRHESNPVWLTLLRFDSLVHPRHRSTFVLHCNVISSGGHWTEGSKISSVCISIQYLQQVFFLLNIWMRWAKSKLRCCFEIEKKFASPRSKDTSTFARW